MKKTLICGLALLISTSSIAQVWRPLSRTCKNLGNDSAESFLGMKVGEFEKLPDEEGMRYLKNNFEKTKENYYNTFLVLNSPSVSIAEKALRLNLMELMRKTCGEVSLDNSLPMILAKLKPCLKNHFKGLRKRHTNFSDHPLFFEPFAHHLKQAQGVLHAICEKVSIERPKCNSDLIPYLTLINPGNFSTKVTVPQEFFRISVDPELTSLAEEFSYYYIDRLYVASQKGKTAGRDVFEDLVNFFELKGKTNTEARKLSLYFLGVYGVRGASFHMPVYAFHPTALSAMVLLSVGMSYLDKLALQQGKIYAIPHQYKTACSVGKPYHFWMAAFLADYASKQGFSTTIGYFGPVIAGIAYDLRMEANGRDIRKLFAIKTPYDYYANMTRIDNWSRAMGAHFGKNQGKVRSMNADALLDEMFSRSKMPTKDPGEDMVQQLKEYMRIVQPVPMIMRLAL